ncbi:MAG: 3-deoxy-manno-octulosonate cytidylyltransferase [Spirochaetes bacterium]|nr:3-deoxy-manno-octulosonate cytidylyltransferase [Spirochaetota bacterium]
MKFIALIPARFRSTRLPGKVLKDINGKPLIYHVYMNTRRTSGIDDCIVCCDEDPVADACRRNDINYIMTGTHHTSGTSRIAEAAARIEADVIINVQGDEPMISSKILTPLMETFNDPAVDIATVVKRTDDENEIQNENVVKAVIDAKGFAMYFSRATIPHRRKDVTREAVYRKHIGVYAYRKNVLLDIVKLPPCDYESIEMLEQLRWLHAGYRIRTIETAETLYGVDTPEDLALVTDILKNRHS